MELHDKTVIINGTKDAILKSEQIGSISDYYIDELAYLLALNSEDADSFLALYNEIMPQILPQNIPTLTRTQFLSKICTALCKHLTSKGVNVSLADFFEAEETSSDTVVYVKSAISDEAYMKFAKAVNNAAVSYAQSFPAACEEVYYGRADFCILPYENSAEGSLSGFAQLMRKYELYKQCVCTCKSPNGNTKMALVSRAPCMLVPPQNEKIFLKITFFSPKRQTISNVSACAETLSLDTVKLESIPLSFDDGRYGHELTFCGELADIIPFLLFISLEVPECSDKEIFFEIK